MLKSLFSIYNDAAHCLCEQALLTEAFYSNLYNQDKDNVNFLASEYKRKRYVYIRYINFYFKNLFVK